MDQPTAPPSLDDEHWLRALAGEPVTGDTLPDQVSLNQAAILRQALLRQEDRIDAALSPILAQGPDALMDHLRRASLLTSDAPQPKHERSSLWLTGWAFAGAFASLMTLAVIPPMFFERDQLPITLQADQQALLMRVEDPYRHAQQVAADIRRAGGKAHIRKQVNGHVMLYAEATPDVDRTMRQHNMNPPIDRGMFVIAFVPMNEAPSLSKSTS